MKTILVIDDEQSIMENIVETLEYYEYSTLSAPNGAIGLQLARQHLPDLILCDVMMPEMDGYRMLLALRSDPITSLIPLMFLSAKVDRQSVRYGIELGADDYLTKPFIPEELISAVNARLKRQELIADEYAKRLESLYDSVLHTLPHELRTPLVGILGLSELMSMDGRNMNGDEIVEMAETIHRSGKRLHKLIENFLLYAQLEIIRKDPRRLNAIRAQHCEHPGQVIRSIASEQAKQANRENDLILEVLDVDSVQIAQENLQKIILELVDNALKFSSPGMPVQVNASAHNGNYILTVNDYGIGMTPDEIAKIGVYVQFERRLREQQGMGLGLAIASLIAELYNGELTVDGIAPKGTSVHVRLNLT
ncbi:MAG: hybrid sensor histidine kinase/response regulator [Chloroflexota bacterium]